jgi:voltage-gated potassium channel
VNNASFKDRLYIIIFETNTPWGKAFDIGLLVAIILSVATVSLESVQSLSDSYQRWFDILEWGFTILFTMEYGLRLWITPRKRAYVFSFFGLVDLLSTLPTYIALVLTGAHSLIVLRSFRLLRVFRVFKLARFVGEASQLRKALKASRHKIIVFITAVSIIVVIMGTIMFIIEGGENGFTSIPRSVYWAIVTLTTVGYGDIAPITIMGQSIAALIMILGYAIIAVPTGIVTAEIGKSMYGRGSISNTSCENCSLSQHDVDATYCKNCGDKLPKSNA